MGKKYTIAWKSALPASTKEEYANKFQLLCIQATKHLKVATKVDQQPGWDATKHLKVEFHSGETENGKHK